MTAAEIDDEEPEAETFVRVSDQAVRIMLEDEPRRGSHDARRADAPAVPVPQRAK
jgi:hypothetical protein